ncbi:MAG: Hydrolase [Parcubacteria group bacterium GW2011_GWA2_38_13]|nr:MAG: Hydrolase [Parcubacteria group bacterium GW2011_GWA2_38_13]
MDSMRFIVNFLFETGMLAKTPRSGFHFLGSGDQSVAEHTNRTVFIGYVLAMLDGKANISKVLKMCLFHDLPEARTSDLNYVHQKYASADEEKAIQELTESIPFGKDIKNILEEYKARVTIESILAKDADNLEFILSLKEQADTGNSRAKEWLTATILRLKTETAVKLAEKIMSTDSAEWWHTDKNGPWWVNRE